MSTAPTEIYSPGLEGVLAGETNRVPWDLKLNDIPKVLPHHEGIRAFATAVRDGLPSPIPLEDTLNVVRILEAFYRSAESACEVPIV